MENTGKSTVKVKRVPLPWPESEAFDLKDLELQVPGARYLVKAGDIRGVTLTSIKGRKDTGEQISVRFWHETAEMSPQELELCARTQDIVRKAGKMTSSPETAAGIRKDIEAVINGVLALTPETSRTEIEYITREGWQKARGTVLEIGAFSEKPGTKPEPRRFRLDGRLKGVGYSRIFGKAEQIYLNAPEGRLSGSLPTDRKGEVRIRKTTLMKQRLNRMISSRTGRE